MLYVVRPEQLGIILLKMLLLIASASIIDSDKYTYNEPEISIHIHQRCASGHQGVQGGLSVRIPKTE